MLKLNFRNKIYLIIILSIVAFAFRNALKNGFVAWDDIDYVVNNPLIKIFSLNNFYYIFSHSFLGNYHPLTMLSYLLDYQLWGLNATWYHFHNIVLHVANCILVYVLITALFKDVRVSLIVVLLFGIHPFHVESVAWISERKDLLYVLYYLLSIIFYVKYIKQGKRKFLLLSILMFLLSILSKGQAVSLTLSIIAIDIFYNRNLLNKKIILEKIPFVVLSIVFGLIAIHAQSNEGEINSWNNFNLFERIVLSSYSFCQYIIEAFMPYQLSALHPYPLKINNTLPHFYYLYPIFIFVFIFIAVLFFRKKKNDYLFGMLFYMANIIFVIQLIPVGDAIFAERYSYLSLLGIFIIAACFLVKFSDSTNKIATRIIYFIVVCYFAIFIYLTDIRVKVWHDSFALFNDIIKKYPSCEIARNSRASLYIGISEYEKAINDLNIAISIDTNYVDAYYNRAIAKTKSNNTWGAIEDYDKVTSLNENYLNGWYNKANLKRENGLLKEACLDYSKVINIDSTYWQAYNNRALCELGEKKYQEAFLDIEHTIKLKSENVPSYYLRGLIKVELGKDPCDDFSYAYAKGFDNAGIALKKYCKNIDK